MVAHAHSLRCAKAARSAPFPAKGTSLSQLLNVSVKCFYWNALALGLIWRLRDLRRGGRADSESAYAVFTGWVAGLIPVVYTQVSTLF